MTTPDEFDAKAERLARATDAIVAPAGLTDAVMAKLARPGLLDGVRRVGMMAVALASVAAALSLLVSFQVEDSLDADALATFPVVELEE
jgi:hypothetical protein